MLLVLLTAMGCQAPGGPAREAPPETSPVADGTPLFACSEQFDGSDRYRVRITFLDINYGNQAWGRDGRHLVGVLRGNHACTRWRTNECNPFAQYQDVHCRAEYTPGIPLGVQEDVVIALDLVAERERWRVPIPLSGPPPNGGSFYSVRVNLNPASPGGVYVETVDHMGHTGWLLERATGKVIAGPMRQDGTRQRR